MSDRIKGPLRAFISNMMRRVDYYGLYAGKVVAQSGDWKTVDVEIDDQRIGSVSAVPLRLGIPGAAVQVPSGCRLRIGWDGGDPQKPYAALWDGGEMVVQLKINGGTHEVARKTDSVYCGKMSGVAGPFPVTFAMVPPAVAGDNVTPSSGHVAAGPSVDIDGFITSGVGEVKA